MIKINTEFKTDVQVTGHYDDGQLKTHPCEIGEKWGNHTCKVLDINSIIDEIQLVDGKYEITITINKVS